MVADSPEWHFVVCLGILLTFIYHRLCSSNFKKPPLIHSYLKVIVPLKKRYLGCELATVNAPISWIDKLSRTSWKNRKVSERHKLHFQLYSCSHGVLLSWILMPVLVLIRTHVAVAWSAHFMIRKNSVALRW